MKETFRKSLGKVIQARRKQLTLTQEQLARRSGMHRTYVSDIERGERNLSLESIYNISKGISTPLSVLFAEAEDLANKAAGGGEFNPSPTVRLSNDSIHSSSVKQQS